MEPGEQNAFLFSFFNYVVAKFTIQIFHSVRVKQNKLILLVDTKFLGMRQKL